MRGPTSQHVTLNAIQSWVPKTGVFSVSDCRGFFHPDTGANAKITNGQTKARTDMTRLLSCKRGCLSCRTKAEVRPEGSAVSLYAPSPSHPCLAASTFEGRHSAPAARI